MIVDQKGGQQGGVRLRNVEVSHDQRWLAEGSQRGKMLYASKKKGRTTERFPGETDDKWIIRTGNRRIKRLDVPVALRPEAAIPSRYRLDSSRQSWSDSTI
jgi:hypothetical protein